MTLPDFALFGAKPTFPRPLPIGQRYFPTPDRYERAFRGIFERQYYTEYGPLNQRLERELQRFFGVEHAICVTNESIALMMTVDALGATGKVIVAGLAVEASATLRWMGLCPLECDISRETLQVDPAKVAESIDASTSAIVAADLWGGACDVGALQAIANAYGIPLIIDARDAFGCKVRNSPLGDLTPAHVFSFQQDYVVNAAEGGCVCTDDDALAARLRTMRGSAGAGTQAEVAKTVNGRMSEGQAALALIGLEDFPVNRSNNETLHRTYCDSLASVAGIDVVQPHGVAMSNFQRVICRIDEDEFGLPRDTLVELLIAENVAARPLPPTDRRMPNAFELSRSCVELPIGQLVTLDGVRQICSVLSRAHHSAAAIGASTRRETGYGATLPRPPG